MSKTVIEMARESFVAKYNEDPTDPTMALEWWIFSDGFEAAAALVAAQEREACALVCENTTEYGALDEHGETKAYSSAAAIRARKEET